MATNGKPQDAKKGKPGRPRNEPITEFGRWFQRSGLSQDAICDVIGFRKSYTSELICGKKMPRLVTAVKLIEFSRTTNERIIKAKDFLPDEE